MRSTSPNEPPPVYSSQPIDVEALNDGYGDILALQLESPPAYATDVDQAASDATDEGTAAASDNASASSAAVVIQNGVVVGGVGGAKSCAALVSSSPDRHPHHVTSSPTSSPLSLKTQSANNIVKLRAASTSTSDLSDSNVNVTHARCTDGDVNRCATRRA